MSREQIIDFREGKRWRELAGKLSHCACFNLFTINHIYITLKPSHLHLLPIHGDW